MTEEDKIKKGILFYPEDEELVAKNGYYATVYYHQYPMAAKMREQGVK